MYSMKRLRHGVARRQAGATTLGFIMIAAFAGLFVFAILRLTPVYLNYMKVAGVVEGVRTEFDGQQPSIAVIRRSLARRFDVESISVITYRNVTVVPASGGFEVAAVYDHTAPFIANVSFTVHFDKSVLVRR